MTRRGIASSMKVLVAKAVLRALEILCTGSGHAGGCFVSSTLVVAEKSHSELGASVAARWMACPGSVQLSRGRPNESSAFAQEGTAAHALGELCLRRGADPATFVGTTLDGVEVDADMAEHVRVYVDYCRRIPQGYAWIEKQFNLGALNPPGPMFGTADFVARDVPSRTLDVVDLKYGKGSSSR
jgi:hypothetical protein